MKNLVKFPFAERRLRMHPPPERFPRDPEKPLPGDEGKGRGGAPKKSAAG